jgi:hypothetical protein
MKPVTVAWFVLLIVLFLLAGCSRQPTLCSGLETSQQNKCILDAATAQQDAHLCNSIQNDGFRTWCISSVANASNSTATCESIANGSAREFCKRDVIVSHSSFAECQSIGQPARDDCFDAAARSTLDWRPCLGMTEGTPRESCLEDVARLAKDPQGCLALAPQNRGRDGCLFITSIAANSPATCSQIADTQFAAYCVINIAVNQRNISLCNTVTPGNYSPACRQLVRNATTAQQP